MKKELLNNCLYFKDERENPYEFKDDFKELKYSDYTPHEKYNELFAKIVDRYLAEAPR